jgi:hypothetical protein
VHDLALFLHIVGAVLFFAGMAVAGVGEAAARRRRRPGEIALLLGAGRTGVALVGVGLLLVLVFGLWLTDLSGFGFDGWVVAALVLLALAAVAGGIGGQAPKRARRLAERLAAENDEPSPELDALLRQPVAIALNVVAALAGVAILALMVWKPGA